MIPFFKLSGCGNDFIALVEPEAPPQASAIRAWCRRGLSLGADGVFTLRRTRPETVEMRYWNSDGGAAALCLNGTRCAAQLAFHLGWVRDRVTVVKLNIDDNPLTPGRYGVRGIPTLMVFKDGKVAATKVGAMPKSKIVEWLNESV